MAEALIPIVQRAYDFAVNLYGAVNRFPRAQKPLLGRELVGLALRLLVTLVTANRRHDKGPELEAASGALDALRITLRLSTRLGLLSHTGYEALSRDADEIGRMLGGWLKQSTVARADTPEARPVEPGPRRRGRGHRSATGCRVPRSSGTLRAGLAAPSQTPLPGTGRNPAPPHLPGGQIPAVANQILCGGWQA